MSDNPLQFTQLRTKKKMFKRRKSHKPKWNERFNVLPSYDNLH